MKIGIHVVWLPHPPQVQFNDMGLCHIHHFLVYSGVGTITVVDGNMNAQKYIETLEDYLWPVIVRHFPNEDYIYQDDNAPKHRARVVANFQV